MLDTELKAFERVAYKQGRADLKRELGVLDVPEGEWRANKALIAAALNAASSLPEGYDAVATVERLPQLVETLIIAEQLLDDCIGRLDALCDTPERGQTTLARILRPLLAECRSEGHE